VRGIEAGKTEKGSHISPRPTYLYIKKIAKFSEFRSVADATVSVASSLS
jgi:hypothetical protein